jgi:hypothetical protein
VSFRLLVLAALFLVLDNFFNGSQSIAASAWPYRPEMVYYTALDNPAFAQGTNFSQFVAAADLMISS